MDLGVLFPLFQRPRRLKITIKINDLKPLRRTSNPMRLFFFILQSAEKWSNKKKTKKDKEKEIENKHIQIWIHLQRIGKLRQNMTSRKHNFNVTYLLYLFEYRGARKKAAGMKKKKIDRDRDRKVGEKGKRKENGEEKKRE